MKCVTSLRYARRVRALFRLANQISSSGIPASWSTLMRCIDPRLDGTRAFVVLIVLSFLAILALDLIRDNPVYHVLIVTWFWQASIASFPHGSFGWLHPSLDVLSKLCF
jgi:hypothetical protein